MDSGINSGVVHYLSPEDVVLSMRMIDRKKVPYRQEQVSKYSGDGKFGESY